MYRTKFLNIYIGRIYIQWDKVYTKFEACHFLKRNKKQYEKLPPKEVETEPWDNLCVDLIYKYQFIPKGLRMEFQIKPKGDEKNFKITTKSEKPPTYKLTMVDQTTGLIEIRTVPSARMQVVTNQVELA